MWFWMGEPVVVRLSNSQIDFLCRCGYPWGLWNSSAGILNGSLYRKEHSPFQTVSLGIRVALYSIEVGNDTNNGEYIKHHHWSEGSANRDEIVRVTTHTRMLFL